MQFGSTECLPALLIVAASTDSEPTLLSGQFDQINVRVLPRSIEHDLFSVRRDVERIQQALIAQVGQRARLFGDKIERPEVQRLTAGQVDEFSVGRETMTAAQAHEDLGHLDRLTVWPYPENRELAANDGAAVHNQSRIRGTDRISHLAGDQANGGAAVYWNPK